jgi:hypothetical protein
MPSRGGRDAGSRCAPTADNDVRTNGSMREVRPGPGSARQWPALPSLADGPRPPPHRPTQDHPEAAVNPDASHSFAGRASACSASRGSCDHESTPGNAGRQRAAPRVAPPAHSRQHSKSARGRSSCRSAPASGSARTGTAARACPRLEPPPWMDGGRNGWNNAPACVLGTVWGTASKPRLGRLGRRRACHPAGCHCAIVHSVSATALRPRARHEKACGYVDNARALPTSPQAAAKTAKPCMIAFERGEVSPRAITLPDHQTARRVYPTEQLHRICADPGSRSHPLA